MSSTTSPIVVEFPLRGSWITPNTPGTRVPSHGTDLFGERYAYDFVGIDPRGKGTRFYRSNPFRYILLGVPLSDCYGWGQPIYSVAPGIVVQAQDGIPERNPVSPFRDISIMYRNARDVRNNRLPDFRTLSGNFIIIESDGFFAVYAHAQAGSIRVTPGDRISLGQLIANVGHSGNSTAPHLHFQLMDRSDPWTAQGLPCAFREYEVNSSGAWQTVRNGIPKSTDKIRWL